MTLARKPGPGEAAGPGTSAKTSGVRAKGGRRSGSPKIVIARASLDLGPTSAVRTGDGIVAARDLRIGDRVLSDAGELRSVAELRLIAADDPAASVAPVLVRAGALADGIPRNDLLLAPSTALVIDDAVVSAGEIVNGTSVVLRPGLIPFPYCRVVLAEPGILVAEEVMASSGAILDPAQPDELLGIVRTRLAARAGRLLSASARGRIDEFSRVSVRGWAQGADYAFDPVPLQIFVDGAAVGTTMADEYRPDLAQAGVGLGFHGFSFTFPTALAESVPHTISVRRLTDGTELESSPVRIEPSTGYDDALEARLEQAVASLDPVGSGSRALSFLQAQCEKLRAVMAASTSARMADPGRRVLVLTPELPADEAAFARTWLFAEISTLRRMGYGVVLAPSAGGARGIRLDGSGIEICVPPVHGCIEELMRGRENRFDVVLLDGIDAAAPYLGLARRTMTQARIIFVAHELRHLAGADTEANRLLRLEECTAARCADAVVTVSPAVARALAQAVPGACIELVEATGGAEQALRAAIEGRATLRAVG